ncbi:MAG TPA: hypothetical protein VH040_11460 [Usitatibacter sp.]|jgi:hypothetical protein|nr:hypothetical protein [Usitatibacter sp.]
MAHRRLISRIVAAAIAVACFAAHAAAPSLYVASVRSGGVNSDAPISGNLYTVNLSTGASQLVGAIRLPGSRAVGVTGLAFHPKSGILYGITSEQSPNEPHSLITIDPNTGAATLIGDLGFICSDVTFNSQAVLYAWMQTTSQLGTVDLSTGAVTRIGRPHAAGSPSGIAVDPNDMIYVTTKGASGTLDNVDLTTGEIQVGPPLTGAPFSTQISAMSFSPSGLLLAINSNGGSPANARLVTINSASGAVATIGNLPDDSDALAFLTSGGANLAPTLQAMSPGGRVVIIVVSIVLIAVAGTVVFRKG